MINPSMSNIEICDALFADLPKLQIKAETMRPKIIKQFRKERKFPMCRYQEYTHQESRNRFLIVFSANNPAEVANPEVDFVAFMQEKRRTVVVEWGCWMFRPTGSLDGFWTRYLGLYYPHFFERYQERFLGGEVVPFNELLCRYFSRNKRVIPLENNEEIQRNYEKYGEYGKYSFRVHDGLCFIRYWSEGDMMTIGQDGNDFISVVKYLSFIGEKDFFDIQKKAIQEEGDRYLNDFYRGLLEDAAKEALDGRHSQCTLEVVDEKRRG